MSGSTTAKYCFVRRSRQGNVITSRRHFPTTFALELIMLTTCLNGQHHIALCRSTAFRCHKRSASDARGCYHMRLDAVIGAAICSNARPVRIAAI